MLLFWPHLVTFLLALIIAHQSIPKVKALASHYGYLDVPAARKVHKQPIVRLGGVAICLGTLVSLGIIWLMGGMHFLSNEIHAKLIWLLAGSFAFFLIGLADDLFNLAATLRLVLQFGVAALVWLGGVQIEFLAIPGIGIVDLDWFSLPLTLLWLAGVVNAINWIDGLDGLAAGISTIACGAIFVVALAMGQPLAALVIAALAGSLLGFLRYNFNPAQIFMGDSGSYFVGFLLAGVSVLGLLKGATAAIILPPLILAVPILDMSAVITARLWQGVSPFRADKRHLHHRLLKLGLSHQRTVLFMYSLSLWTGSLAIALISFTRGLLILSATTFLLAYFLWKICRSPQSY